MIITITGPSGSGKTSLIKQLIKKYPNDFIKVISTTTRKPYSYENIQDYNFIQMNDFHKQDYIEYTKYNHNFYGIKKDNIDKRILKNSNKIYLISADIKGMKILKKFFSNINIYSVYLEINENLAKQRLAKRKDWNWKKATKRIQTDKAAGLYNRNGFDCVLNGSIHKIEKLENFLNYVESRMWINKINNTSSIKIEL